VNIEAIYREESGRILATLIRLLGDFELAEEAMQDGFAAALEQWPGAGTPANPRAWLVSTARHKALDRLRRRSRFEDKREEIARLAELEQEERAEAPGVPSDNSIADDRLRLLFTCCHPSLAPDAQIALTLKTLCGLSTEEIARAFLVPVPTMAQRLVRVKQKIRDAGIPYRVPPEAIRLARVLCALMPDRPQARGLLALMLLHDSRREARLGPDGEVVLLQVQDRSRWDQEQIREGRELAEHALREAGPAPYAVQAAIAALHAEARRPEDTDWRQIAGLYDVLLNLHPSPVVELNRAVAVAQAYGAQAGLPLLDDLDARGELPAYHLLPAARADLLKNLGRFEEAAAAYRHALALVANEPERRFLERRLAEVEKTTE